MPMDTQLVQIVVRIYPHILHIFGLEAVRYFSLKYKDFHPRYNIPFISYLKEKKTCVIENEHFLLYQGTAMSAVLQPNYAKLSFEYHKIKVYYLDIRQYFMKNFQRLLDDCEILSKTYLRQQDDLLTILTSIDNDIPFSMDISYNKFPFLDIVIIKSSTQIWINIFSKPTDSKHCFLQFYSPKTLFKEYIILTCKVDMYHSKKQEYQIKN